jgi:biopolymer transport protein ExbD
MTPFVDIAFLILSLFKPPDIVEIKTPGSVLSQKLPENNAVMISFDSTNRVFFTVLSEKDPQKYTDIIKEVNDGQSLGLTPSEMANFRNIYMVGVPLAGVKQLLAMDAKAVEKLRQPGIPVEDSANNQLYWWVRAAKNAFAGEKLNYLIKGDANSKYPAFEAVVAALKRNEEYKYNLITTLDGGEAALYEANKAKNK